MTSAVMWAIEDVGWVVFIEGILLVAILAIAAAKPLTADHFFSWLENKLRPVALSPVRQLIVVGSLAIAVRAMLLPVVGPPIPFVHDEHSLLLLGETLYSGRLTNPPHPLWQHFESIHINQQPTYSSIYFIGRGFPHLIGFALGHPWLGVWLSVAAMCIAICWAVQAWASLPCALVVSVIAVLHYATLNYWINSYYGAAFTAFGGALVIGALPRLVRTNSTRYGWILGLGIIVLITTRPYEGLLLCIAVAVAILYWIVKQQRPTAALVSVLPAALCTVVGAALILVHARAVTGQATLLPYELNRRQYALAPPFLFVPPYKGPKRGDERMRRFYEWEERLHSRRNSIAGLIKVAGVRVRQVFIFFITPALLLPFLVGCDLRKSRKAKFLVAALALLFAGYLVETWGFPQYFSPGTVLVLALAAIGFVRLRAWTHHGRPSGLFLSRALPLLSGVVVLYPASAVLLNFDLTPPATSKYVCCELNSYTDREGIGRHLDSVPGRDLVIVSYSPSYDLFVNWVYNQADIDNSSIVWARDLGREKNQALVSYYKDRRIWWLMLERGKPPQLEPYNR